jgi:hypothetical protein
MSRPRSQPEGEIGDTDDHDVEAEDAMVNEGGYVPPVVGAGTGSIFEGLTIHQPAVVETASFEFDEKDPEKTKADFNIFRGLTIKVSDKSAEPEVPKKEPKSPGIGRKQ